MKRTLIFGGAVAALLLAACSSSDVAAPGALQLSSSDTAMAAAVSASDATSEDINLMTASEASMDGSTPAYDLLRVSPFATTSTTPGATTDSVRYAFWAAAQSCTYSATTGRFTCPDVVKNGLTLSRSAAFYDVHGAPMAHYDALATDSANFQMSVSGVHQALLGADTISRQRTMTVTGLLGQETSRTWNGTGTRSDHGSRQDTEALRTYAVHDDVTFTNVVVNLPRSQNPWPMSGTVTRQMTGTGSVSRSGTTRTFTVTKTVTITFNGTRYVPMTVGTLQFTLDLYTGTATRVVA